MSKEHPPTHYYYPLFTNYWNNLFQLVLVFSALAPSQAILSGSIIFTASSMANSIVMKFGEFEFFEVASILLLSALEIYLEDMLFEELA